MRFLHSPQEFSVSDFYHHYKNALPKIVIVTQGYFGEIGIETYDRDQVLRIHTHSVQKRVVADVIKKSSFNLEGKQLSIPVEFPTKFYVINKNGHRSKKDEFLSDILQKYGKSFPITVEFSDRDDHKLLIGSELRSINYFQQLSLVDTYEDVYLLGNPISEGKLYAKVLSVPLYLQEMRLSIVTGIEGCLPNVWQMYIDGMTASVDNRVKFDTTSGNKNIAVLSKSSGTNYALTSPCEYYNMGELSASAMDFQSKGNAQPNYQNPIYEPDGMEALVPRDTNVQHENQKNVQSRVKVFHLREDERFNSTGTNVPPKRPPPVMPKTKPTQFNVPADQGLKQKIINTTDDIRSLPQMKQKPKDIYNETKEAAPSVQKLKAMLEQSQADKQIAMHKRNEVTNLLTPERPRLKSSGDDDYCLKFETFPEELNLKDFYERFNPVLPKVVIVTQGYYGEIGLETYDKDQVIRIHTYSQQKRVVCQVLEGDESNSGLKGKYLTIPTTYPVKFNVIKHGTFTKSKSKDLSLTEIIDTYDLPLRVQFSKADDGAVISVDSREISTKLFSRLEVIEVYEEVYLLGNPITFGKLYSNIMLIPVYLPDIKLSVVTGVIGESKESWDTYFVGMNRSVEKLQFDRESGNKNIAIYSATRFDTGETDQYTYQYPTEYYKASQTQDVGQQNPRASGLYEDLRVAPRRDAVCLYEPISFKKRLSESFEEKSYQPPVPLRPCPPNEDTQTVALPVPRREARNPSSKPYTDSKDEKKLQPSADSSKTENIHKSIPPKIDRSNKPIFSTKSLNLKEFEFECSREQLSVKEFYKLYKNDLPKLAMITQGYCGNISLETYARGETLRIHKCLTQKRVIAEEAGLPTEGGFRGQKFSIPIDIECKFRVVKGSGKDLSLQEIVKKQMPVEVKFSKSDKNRTLMVGSDQRNTSHFHHLHILDIHDDLYLLGNTLSDGCLYGKVVSIPAYLPDLKLCAINGIKGKSNNEWKSYLSEMQNTVEQKVNFDSCSGNNDIAIYDSHEIKIDSEFPFVSPNIYTNLEQLLQGNVERHHMEQIASNVYDEIPADKIKDRAFSNRPGSVITNPIKSSRPPMTPKKDTIIPGSKPSVPLPPLPVSGKKPVPLPSPSVSAKPPVQLPIRIRRQSQQFNVKQLTINEISSVLHQLNLDKYIKRFADGRVDGVILAELDIECLEQDFNLKRHQAIKLLNFVQDGHIPSMERSVKALNSILEGSDEQIDVQSLTVTDICDSLQVLNLGRHIVLFEMELIDGSILVKLSENDLKILGLSRFEAVKLLAFATKGHIPK